MAPNLYRKYSNPEFTYTKMTMPLSSLGKPRLWCHGFWSIVLFIHNHTTKPLLLWATSWKYWKKLASKKNTNSASYSGCYCMGWKRRSKSCYSKHYIKKQERFANAFKNKDTLTSVKPNFTKCELRPLFILDTKENYEGDNIILSFCFDDVMTRELQVEILILSFCFVLSCPQVFLVYLITIPVFIFLLCFHAFVRSSSCPVSVGPGCGIIKNVFL